MVELRWMFLNSEVMGFAYLLNSKTRGLENMITTDKPDTKKQLRDYIDMYFNEEARFAQQSKTELVEYLTRFDSEDIDNIIVDSELECFQWWLFMRNLIIHRSARFPYGFIKFQHRRLKAKETAASSTTCIPKNKIDCIILLSKTQFSSILIEILILIRKI